MALFVYVAGIRHRREHAPLATETSLSSVERRCRKLQAEKQASLSPQLNRIEFEQ